jgi:hypothetical protein
MRRFMIAGLVLLLVVDSLRAIDRPFLKRAPAGPPAPPAATAEEDVVSETIGTLAVAYLNQAYLSIGILSDAVAEEAYEDADALELLELHLGAATMVGEQLQKLAKSPAMDQEEAVEIRQLIQIAELIKKQGETLAAVWSGDDSKIPVWEKLRDQTGNEIEKLLGEEEPEKK